RRTLQLFRQVALKRAQVLVTEAVDGQRVRVGREESKELADLGAVRAHGVRAAVGFELKPAEVFVCCGLEGEWHSEAVAHDNGGVSGGSPCCESQSPAGTPKRWLRLRP